MNRTTPAISLKRQTGVALVVALVFLLMLTLLGLSSSQVSMQQERMAGNYLELTRAKQAAERALRDIERQLTALIDSRPTAWDIEIREWSQFPALVDEFRADCTLETLFGDDWPNAPMSTFNGGDVSDFPAPPEYLVIELAEYLPAGAPIQERPPCYPMTRLLESPEAHSYYLITVRGFGPGPQTRRAEAMVQSIFYRERL